MFDYIFGQLLWFTCMQEENLRIGKKSTSILPALQADQSRRNSDGSTRINTPASSSKGMIPFLAHFNVLIVVRCYQMAVSNVHNKGFGEPKERASEMTDT